MWRRAESRTRAENLSLEHLTVPGGRELLKPDLTKATMPARRALSKGHGQGTERPAATAFEGQSAPRPPRLRDRAPAATAFEPPTEAAAAQCGSTPSVKSVHCGVNRRSDERASGGGTRLPRRIPEPQAAGPPPPGAGVLCALPAGCSWGFLPPSAASGRGEGHLGGGGT